MTERPVPRLVARCRMQRAVGGQSAVIRSPEPMPVAKVVAALGQPAGAGALLLGYNSQGARGRAPIPSRVTERVIMKRLLWPLAVVIVSAILGTAGLLVARAGAPAQQTATLRPGASPTPAPTITTTASGQPRATLTPRQAARPTPPRTGPWTVVSAYYQDVNAHRYGQAWALISSGVVTGQTYQQFVAGYACTGTEQPTKLGQSGHQVRFTLVVVNDCTGAAQYYTGTDTVRGGRIIAADVTRTG